MVRISAFAFLLLASASSQLGCKRTTTNSQPKESRPPQPTSQPRRPVQPLRWFADDYARARARARADGKLLLIDMWAGWCHTCLSMKQVVLVDPVLRPTLRRFVRLAIDTENQRNTKLLARLPLKFWPTFFVIDPRDEQIVSRYVGAASVAQFAAFLQTAQKTSRAASPDPPAQPRQALLAARDGDRAAIAGDLPAADAAYGRALALAPADWIRRPDVLVSQISVRHQAKRYGDCVALGLASAGQTGSSASAADFLYYAVDCAEKLPPGKNRSTQRQRMLRAARGGLMTLLDRQGKALSVDDRSDAMRMLRVVHDKLGQTVEARAVAERQRRLLERAAAAAPSPQAAAIYNWPRAEVAVYLGKGAELIADLQRSCEALPRDYDPPYRLAWVLAKLKRHAEALAAAKRSLKLAYGPRAARVKALIAEIEQKVPPPR